MKYIKPKSTKTNLVGALFLAVLLAQALLPSLVPKASAGSLSSTLVRFDRMTTSTATTGTVCAAASAAAAGTEAKVMVTFPAGYTLGVFGTFTVNTTNTGWPSGATAWPGILTATAVNSQSVTFPSSDLTDTTEHCFNWANSAAVTTSASATNNNLGTVTTQTSAPATIDSGSYATATVGNDSVLVTASVNPTFSLAVTGNSDTLGTISTGAVKSSPTPPTLTIGTNAKNGWMAWGKDTAPSGLTSTATGYTIPSNCSGSTGSNFTLAGGTEGFNTGVTSFQSSGTGSLTVAGPFVGGATGKGGGLCSALQTIASRSGTATADVLTLTNNAAISNSTPAANDYADTETFVAGGLF